MSKKQSFIKIVQQEIFDHADIFTEQYDPEDWSNACEYWETFSDTTEKEKPMFTDNGKLILQFMQSTMPQGKAKDIGEGLFISSRVVSGAIRKLVSDGYVEKVSQDPVVYALTNKGKEVIFEGE